MPYLITLIVLATLIIVFVFVRRRRSRPPVPLPASDIRRANDALASVKDNRTLNAISVFLSDPTTATVLHSLAMSVVDNIAYLAINRRHRAPLIIATNGAAVTITMSDGIVSKAPFLIPQTVYDGIVSLMDKARDTDDCNKVDAKWYAEVDDNQKIVRYQHGGNEFWMFAYDDLDKREGLTDARHWVKDDRWSNLTIMSKADKDDVKNAWIETTSEVPESVFEVCKMFEDRYVSFGPTSDMRRLFGM